MNNYKILFIVLFSIKSLYAFATGNTREGWFMQGDWLITNLKISENRIMNETDSLIIGVNFQNRVFEYFNKSDSNSILISTGKFGSKKDFLDTIFFENLSNRSNFKSVTGFKKINQDELLIFSKGKQIGRMCRLKYPTRERSVVLGTWFFDNKCFKRKPFPNCGKMVVTANNTQNFDTEGLPTDMVFKGTYNGNTLSGDFGPPVIINVMVFYLNIEYKEKKLEVPMIYNSHFLMIPNTDLDL